MANFLWKKKGTTSNVEGAQVSSLTDNTLCFRKSENALIKPRIKEKETRSYPHTDCEGSYRTTVIEKKDSGSYKRASMKFEIIGHLPREGKRWQMGRDSVRYLENKNRFIWDGEKVILKIYDFEDKDTTSARPNLLFDNGSTDSAANMIKELFDGKEELFDNPKPIELIRELIDFSSNKNDIILDFFAGSATTAHAVMELNKEGGGNRKYVLVQMPEPCDEKSEAYKAGYHTIADIAKERIRRAGGKITEEIDAEIKDYELRITKLQSELPTEETEAEIETLKTKIEQLKTQDLGFKVLKLADSNFKQWQQPKKYTEEEIAEQASLFIDPVSESAAINNIIYELLLKTGKDLNSKIERKNGYCKINDKELVLILEKITQDIVDTVLSEHPEKVIALDRLFDGNDRLKTNTALQMRDAGVEFRTV